MYLLYLDEFGHTGRWIPNDRQYGHHPFLGLAGFAIPGDRWADLDRQFFRLKRDQRSFPSGALDLDDRGLHDGDHLGGIPGKGPDFTTLQTVRSFPERCTFPMARKRSPIAGRTRSILNSAVTTSDSGGAWVNAA